MAPQWQAVALGTGIAVRSSGRPGDVLCTSKIPGFVHRDLKPENILVGADRTYKGKISRVRVTDFGLVSVLQDAYESGFEDSGTDTRFAPGRTQLTRGIVGTPHYMAPEQWEGGKLTVRTDIYAFGCILYEMLSGQPAVEGKSTDALVTGHCKGKIQPMPSEVPKVVIGIVTQCLSKRADTRYAD